MKNKAKMSEAILRLGFKLEKMQTSKTFVDAPPEIKEALKDAKAALYPAWRVLNF